jgi:hypothetical protein
MSGNVWADGRQQPVARIDGQFDGSGFVGAFVATNGERGEWEWLPSDSKSLTTLLDSEGSGR